METYKIHQENKKLIVSEADVSGSSICMAMMNHFKLKDVAATHMHIIDANLSDLEIDGAQMGGAFIHNIGMPPEGHPAYDADARQRPLKFDNCDLNSSLITNCNLKGVELRDCNTEEMKIDGVLVSDLLMISVPGVIKITMAE